ncbi:MAG: sn-glycerol-3-phosphate ABC transporter ATP-binding protein UgpC [Clostridiales bacterium]|nr:sn-glycerol-3-phosphate ABC transporter ATP-binding protein UgpC [Clostridiales bacterium]
MASLQLKNIKKTYGNGITAVNDFNLDIADQEFIIFVGPSGCGKSTTLRMIAGLEEITEGELYIGDKLMNDVAPKDRDIAMVFQNYALYPHMTVYDNMAFGLKLRKTPKAEIEQRVKEAAKILEIEHLLDRKPKALSGGQRQRVAMGRAIVREPKVFLMDEPLSNLDAKLRVQMRVEIAKLHQRLKATIIYVTHDQVEAMTLGTRIVVMKDGIMQQVASPITLYNEPDNLFVAGFIGSPQMNFIDAVAQKEGNDVYLAFSGQKVLLPAEKAQKLVDGGYIGKEVILGIRPEDIHATETSIARFPQDVVTADVNVTELLGADMHLYLIIGDDDNIVATVSARQQIKAGDRLKLAFDPAHIHIFDKETELTITN